MEEVGEALPEKQLCSVPIEVMGAGKEQRARDPVLSTPTPALLGTQNMFPEGNKGCPSMCRCVNMCFLRGIRS